MPNDYIFKLLLVGDKGAGKTCLMKRFVADTFGLEEKPTIGVEFGTKFVQTIDKTTKLQIWDTSGNSEYKRVAMSYYSGAAIFLLCCDLTNKASFVNLKSHLKDVREKAGENAVIILVGTKVDNVEQRVISDDDLKTFATENGLTFSFTSSAKDNQGVNTIFETAVNEVLKRVMKQSEELSNDVNTVKQPTLEERLGSVEGLRKIYLDNDGGWLSAKKIFGFFDTNPISEVIETLKEHSIEDPNGASAKTLREIGVLKTMDSANTQPSQSSSSGSSSDGVASSSTSVTPKQGK